MTEEESKPEREEIQDEDDTPVRKFNNNYLLDILEKLALKILQKKVVNCTPDHFVITVEDELINEWNMRSGNPVIIRVQTGYILRQFQSEATLHVLAHGLQYALEMVPKMRHTLSMVPLADVIYRTEEIRRWKKAASEKALYFDKVLPEKEITYTETVRVVAVHKPTGLHASITEKINKANPTMMRSVVRKLLTEVVRRAPPERDSTRQSVCIGDAYFRSATTWTSIPRGFAGNEVAPVEEE
jgi:hypothetical protein